MIRSRRRLWPKVKVYGGLYSVSRQPKNDPLLREIQEAVKNMSVDRHNSSDEVTIVGTQKTEKIVPPSYRPAESSL